MLIIRARASCARCWPARCCSLAGWWRIFRLEFLFVITSPSLPMLGLFASALVGKGWARSMPACVGRPTRNIVAASQTGPQAAGAGSYVTRALCIAGCAGSKGRASKRVGGRQGVRRVLWGRGVGLFPTRRLPFRGSTRKLARWLLPGIKARSGGSTMCTPPTAPRTRVEARPS
jgi:hypothetical protein